jgi:hypothetical protein
MPMTSAPSATAISASARRPEHDGPDATAASLGLQVEAHDLAATRAGIHQEHALAGRTDFVT